MASAPAAKTLTAATPILNRRTPFIKEMHVALTSPGTPTVYGANAPSPQSTKFQQLKQRVASNKAFELATATDTPQNTTGGALSDANQLRCVAILSTGVILKRARGDQDAPSAGFVVGAGGGTLVGDTTMVFNAAVAADAITSQIKSSGANVKTLIVGDRMTITEGSLTDTVTISAGATMNGTTAVAITHSPVTYAYTTAAVLTFVAATGKAIVINPATALGAGGTVDVWILAAADVETVTGGALVAGITYDIEMNEVFHATTVAAISKLV